MNTDRIEVLLPINHNYNKIFDILGFLKSKHKKCRDFFLAAVKNASVRWHILSNYLDMRRTVLLVLKSGQLIANQI